MSANARDAAVSAARLTAVFLMAALFAVVSLACVSIVIVFFLGVVLQFSGGLLSLLASYVGSCIGAAYCGGIALRIAAMLLPMRGDGARRIGAIVLLCTFIVAIHLSIATVLASLVDFAVEVGDTAGYSWQSQFQGLGALLGVGITVLLYPHVLAMLVMPAAVLLKRHLMACRELQRGALLFLRRFDGRGDSAALAALYHARPRHMPLVFLLAPRGGWRVWDPYLLGLASVRLSNPWGGAPFFLRSGQTWENDVEKRVSLAGAIVIDTTQLTEGVRRELDLIEACGAWPRTVAIRCVGVPSVVVPSTVHGSLEYAASWSAAGGRLLASVAAAVATTLIVMTLFRELLFWSPLVTGLVGLSLLLLYGILFLRPMPDPEFSRSLRRALSMMAMPAAASGSGTCKEA